MEHFRFAICVVLPGATSADVVKAAIAHNVHIIDKEPLDPAKDYSDFPETEMPENGAAIYYLFTSPDGSVLAEDEATKQEAFRTIQRFRRNALGSI